MATSTGAARNSSTSSPHRDAADDDQRSRLLSALFESIDAEALPQRGLRLVAAPRGAWRGFFQSLVLELHTGACSNLSELTRRLKQLTPTSGDRHGVRRASTGVKVRHR